MSSLDFIHMMPIAAVGFVALTLIFERYRALFSSLSTKAATEFANRIQDYVMQGKKKEAIELCDREGSKPQARIYKTALTRGHLPDESVQQGIEIVLGECVREVQKRTPYLAMLANVSTLLGLFGTILGLIHSFEAVGHADAQQKSALLAAGISTAMNATLLGLAVAIPCMVAFSIFQNRTNRLISELDETAIKAQDLIRLSYFSEENQTGSSKAA